MASAAIYRHHFRDFHRDLAHGRVRLAFYNRIAAASNRLCYLDSPDDAAAADVPAHESLRLPSLSGHPMTNQSHNTAFGASSFFDGANARYVDIVRPRVFPAAFATRSMSMTRAIICTQVPAPPTRRPNTLAGAFDD